MILTAAGLLGAACTERRTASDPTPDGDTIEVTIKGNEQPQPSNMPEIIEVPDSIDLMEN